MRECCGKCPSNVFVNPCWMPQFKAYPKTRRIDQESFTISEKIDGTNAVLHVDTAGVIAGCRSRWLTATGSEPNGDNHGFACWVKKNEAELMKLPAGVHYGEWYGKGINRGYGLKERRLMLFHGARYRELDNLPSCVELETVLADDVTLDFLMNMVAHWENTLKTEGSCHVSGFMNTEGLIIRSKLTNNVLKKVWSKD